MNATLNISIKADKILITATGLPEKTYFGNSPAQVSDAIEKYYRENVEEYCLRDYAFEKLEAALAMLEAEGMFLELSEYVKNRWSTRVSLDLDKYIKDSMSLNEVVENAFRFLEVILDDEYIALPEYLALDVKDAFSDAFESLYKETKKKYVIVR